MSTGKRKITGLIRYVFYIFLALLLFFLFTNFFQSFYKVCRVELNVEGEGMGIRPIEVFYTLSEDEEYNGTNMLGVDNDSNEFSYRGAVNLSVSGVHRFRIDLGDGDNINIALSNVKYRDYNGEKVYSAEEIAAMSMHDLEVVSSEEDTLVLRSFKSEGEEYADPYIDFGTPEVTPYRNLSSVYAVIAAVLVTFIVYRFVRLKAVYALFADLIASRRLIFSLAVNDFKTKYAGSYFGVVWSFVQPVCTILVFWFVFQVGLRNSDVGNIPFILWFSSGLIPWFFFSEAWNSATNSFIEYSFLVKKVVFKVHILPLVKIVSNLFVHFFFVCLLFVFFLVYGFKPNIYWIQVVYYSFSMIMLVTGLSYITATLVGFFRDLGQVMNIVLQFGMWLTPIMWQIDMIPSNLMWLFKLNPMYYVVQGYRDSLIYGVPFYNNIKQTLYFWMVVMVLMLIGSLLYRRLKPHFADVL